MTYLEAIQYLESFINYEKIPRWSYKESLKLERIKEFLSSLGNPQDSLNCLHIAGTKGKGSTCAFISYILKEAGFKVGLYTSPHLSCFRERIRILENKSSDTRHQTQEEFEGMISEEEVSELVEKLKPLIEKYNRNSKYGPLSFFEVYTALAFVYFKEKKVDFLVLETGLGGRLDATNVVNALVCGISPISYEHTQKLGNTLAEIAYEKAGIIKGHQSPDTRHRLIVISAPQEKEAELVIRNRCKEVNAKLYMVNKDLFYEKTQDGFNVLGIFGEYPNLKIRLLGRHQLINATVAIGVVEALRFFDIYIDIEAIRNGLYNTFWPARCEIIAKNPLIVLDGAQNVASSRVLKETIRENFSYGKLILVLGISRDKDIKGICEELKDLSDIVILTKANNPRATEPEVLARYFKDKEIYLTQNTQEAIELAKEKANSKDLILVCGSLFVAGEIRDYFKTKITN